MSEDANTEDLVTRAAERVKSLENIIGGRLVYPGMSFNWPELDVKVEIINTKPDLAGKSFAKLAFEALRARTGYQFKTVGIASPFNAVLCIDTSGSMKTTDVPVQDIAHAREGLKDLAGDSPEVHAFLNRFEDTEFSDFLDHMKSYERKMELEKKRNYFLDLYAQWLKNKSDKVKKEINELCKELKELDPSFTFTLE